MVNFTVVTALAAMALGASASPVEFQRRATSTTSGVIYPTLSPEAKESLKKELYVAPSQSEREAILFPHAPDASNITYQFINNTVYAPTAGSVVVSGVDAFPGLIGTNVGMAIGFIGPCGLNVPHLHPRANEFLTVVQGLLIGGMVLEENPGGAGNTNGTNPTGPIRHVNATLSNYRGMVFQKGLVHWQFNPTCEPAVFAAAFDNLDPGRTQLATNFFSVPNDEVLLAATGGNPELLDVNRIDKLRKVIPQAFVEQMESCAKACGIPTSSD